MQKIIHSLAWLATATVVAFAILNWGVLSKPTSLDLLFLSVDAPLGVLMLGMTLAVVVLFAITSMYNRIGAHMEFRKLHAQAQEAQKLADNAELSRLDALERLIASEFRQLNRRLDGSGPALKTETDTGEPHSFNNLSVLPPL